jgi:hypothetical protein
MNLVIAHKGRVYPDMQMMIRDLTQQIKHRLECHRLARADVINLAWRSFFQQLQISFRDKAHIIKFPFHIKIAQLNSLCTLCKMSHQFRDNKRLRLPRPCVIKRAHEKQRQPVQIISCHVFHSQFAHGVMVYRRGRLPFRDRRLFAITVHICATGYQNASWRLRKSRQSVQ